jgi:predicted TIM-barrel fold metal-dependent hydrolase
LAAFIRPDDRVFRTTFSCGIVTRRWTPKAPSELSKASPHLDLETASSGGPVGITPSRSSPSSSTAGFFQLGTDPDGPDTARFLFALRGGADGKWLIAAHQAADFRPVDRRLRTAERIIAELDAAGINRAVVLSVAFWFGDPTIKVEDEYAKVRAENDWVAQQVSPERLTNRFLSFNPLKSYALEELERCSKNPNVKGLKLHFGNSHVDLLNPQHVERIRQVFHAANDKRLPIVVHLWTGQTYGPQHSEAFLNQILPVAPDIPIQIAHMSASGPNYHSDDALEVYANAAIAGDRRMKNVYFDVASMVTRNTRPQTLELVARRLRQLGLQRVLFGSDYLPGGPNDTPKDAWDAFQRLPLGQQEFRTVAETVASYMR